MLTTYKINLDLWKPASGATVSVMQNDGFARGVALSLFEDGRPWTVPEGVRAVARYEKADGHGGVYDADPDGNPAWRAEGNTVTVELVPQVLSVPGPVKLSVDLILGEQTLHTFPVYLDVHEGMASEQEESGGYSKVRGFLPQPSQAAVGQILVVSGLTPTGTVARVEGRDALRLVQETGSDEGVVMSQKAVTDALAKLGQTRPLFARSLDECVDEDALYVLPDGYLYAYMYSEVPLYTNLAQVEDPDWLADSRLNSSGVAVTQAGTLVTRYFPISDGDVFRIKGLDVRYISTGGVANSWRYSAAKAIQGNNVSISTMIANGYATLEGDVFTVPAGRNHLNEWQSNVVYQRFTGTLMEGYSLEDVVITLNQEISCGQQYAWVNTGHAFVSGALEDRVAGLEQGARETETRETELDRRVDALTDALGTSPVPDHWTEHLEEKIRTVRGLQEAGGKDCFSFAVLTDLHESANLGKCSGALARHLMDRCDIRYALCLGDIATRECVATEEDMDKSFVRAEEILQPLRGRLLRTRGNHDGCWDDDGTSFYYREFTPGKLHSLIWRPVGTAAGAVADDTGTAYYVDDPANRVRYILLNSHYAPYEQKEDGSARYSTFRNARFGQEQLSWLAEKGLDVPSGWGIILGSHVPLNDSYRESYGGSAGESILTRELLAAYNSRSEFRGSFPGTMGWDAVELHADFTKAGGRVLAAVAGHSHADTHGMFGIPVITTRCDAAEENASEEKAERKQGTVTEQSFDIFTVDRVTGAISVTKIGAGDDRRIQP